MKPWELNTARLRWRGIGFVGLAIAALSLTAFAAAAAGAGPSKQEPVDARPVKLDLPANVVLTEGVVFSEPEGIPMRMDIFSPSEAGKAGPLPAILLIHGGGWIKGDRASFHPVASHLAENGFVAASIDYRLASEERKAYPEALHDCKAAVRWLRANAERFSIDPERIGVAGSSAGGQLAAMIATTGGLSPFEGAGGSGGFSSKVQAACIFAGPVQMTSERMIELSRKNPKWLANLYLGAGYDDDPDLHLEASPIRYVQIHTPPFLFIDGSNDMPGERNEPMRAKLERLGIEGRLVVIEGGPHGMWRSHPWFKPSMKAMTQFFSRILAKEAPAAERGARG